MRSTIQARARTAARKLPAVSRSSASRLARGAFRSGSTAASSSAYSSSALRVPVHLARCAIENRSELQHAAQLDALRKFARRRKASQELVVAVFESERHRLSEGAKVERFVDVLAEKRAKRALIAGRR